MGKRTPVGEPQSGRGLNCGGQRGTAPLLLLAAVAVVAHASSRIAGKDDIMLSAPITALLVVSQGHVSLSFESQELSHASKTDPRVLTLCVTPAWPRLLLACGVEKVLLAHKMSRLETLCRKNTQITPFSNKRWDVAHENVEV